jgi:hypothetical protein
MHPIYFQKKQKKLLPSWELSVEIRAAEAINR